MVTGGGPGPGPEESLFDVTDAAGWGCGYLNEQV